MLQPDLAVEIVSPNDRADDVREYQQAGVRLVWVLWPQRRSPMQAVLQRTAARTAPTYVSRTCSQRSRGRTNFSVVPRPSPQDSAQMRPPCASTITRHRYSPSPSPSVRLCSALLARAYRLKRLDSSSAGMPMPSS
ncbi:MAG: Uma2 family endonuclease [Chloroflexia bacterium]